MRKNVSIYFIIEGRTKYITGPSSWVDAVWPSLLIKMKYLNMETIPPETCTPIEGLDQVLRWM